MTATLSANEEDTLITTSRRVATTVLCGLLVMGTPVLAGCGNVAQSAAEKMAGDALGGDVSVNESGLSITNSNGDQVQVGGNVSLPSNWPSAIPAYDGGTLVMASAQGDGSSAGASWTVDQPAADVAKAYGDTLVAAGFTAGDMTNAAGMMGGDYTGNGYKVTLLAIEADGTTSLTVSAEKSAG